MSDPVVRNGSVVLTEDELNVLDTMLQSGDRAGFYLTYNAMTDSAEALLQAKIATFSGLVGGAAFAANRFLQEEYGVDGTEQPDRYPGIYYLSQLVARSAYNAIAASADPNGSGTGKISDDTFFQTAWWWCRPTAGSRSKRWSRTRTSASCRRAMTSRSRSIRSTSPNTACCTARC